MILNIPYKFNPMPYYKTTTPPAPDYLNMPMTYECVSGTVNISLPLAQYITDQTNNWGGSNSPIANLSARVDNSEWIDWKGQGFTEITLTAGQKLQLSGNNPGNISRAWGGYYNRFKFEGGGKITLYGNISSLFSSNVTNIFLANMWYGDGHSTNSKNALIDASKFVIPYPPSTGQAFNMLGFNQSLSTAPLFLDTNFSTTAFEFAFQSDTSLKFVEVFFNNSSNWSYVNWFNYNTVNGFFIKPYSTAIPTNRGYSTIPSTWTVLNRIGKKLYYAESKGGHSVGDEYTGEDPYAWYYGT